MLPYAYIVLLSIILFLYNIKKHVIIFINHCRFTKILPGPPVSELRTQNSKTFLEWLNNLAIRYGPIFHVWMGKDLFVFVSNEEDVKTVLSSNELLYKNYIALKPWLRNGLLTNSGSSWHQRRKLLTPAFHFKILGLFKDTIEQKCDILIDRMNGIANDMPIDIYPFITLFALDVISETAMGVNQHVQEKCQSEFVRSTQTICSLLHEQAYSLWKRIPFLYFFSDNKRQRDVVLNFLRCETRRVIKLRREVLQAKNIDAMTDFDENGIKQRFAFLDMLLITQMKGAILTDENIEEEVDTFMFEGHDTTSSALSFALYLLANHSDAQQKAYEEAMEFQNNEHETMKYIEAVIKETLRLFPSVPIYSRIITKPFVIGNYTLPIGCFLNVSAHTLHRNANNFPDPNQFKPERFLTNINYHSHSFVGFSAGPRNCIGQKFAMLELKCALSKLLRAFKFQSVDGFEVMLVHDLIMRSANGIQIRLKRR